MPNLCRTVIRHLRLVSSLLLVCSMRPLLAGQHWINVTTSHFEMFTTNNERQAERALQTFEQVRYFFERNSRAQQAPNGLVRIIAFSSENEFKPYRMNSGNFAFYLQSRERDYIVMQDIEPDHIQAAAHEYTHLIIRHSKLELPLWLDEGLADLYSSLEPRGQQALVGRPLPQHIYTLLGRPWMNFNALFAVDHESPWYNQSDKMQIFYAQSWELTHMLALSPAYKPHFAEFLAAVSGGASTADALRKVYGKSVVDVEKDAGTYLHRTTVPAALFDVTLKKSDLDPQVASLSQFQTGLALCDLLASRPQTADEAHRRLLALEQEDPQNPAVEESLGYLAWQQNNLPEARKHFAAALAHGSQSGRMYYDAANVERMAGGSPQTVLDLMMKAVALRPDDNDSRILLAQLQVQMRLYGQALGTIAPIHNLEPASAFGYYTVSAYCHANLKDLAGARIAVEKAAPFAKTPEQHRQLAEFQEYLDASDRQPAAADRHLTASSGTIPHRGGETPFSNSATHLEHQVPSQIRTNNELPRVHGTTRSFLCGQHTFRLHVLVGQREMVFAIDDPKDIVVRNVTELQWNCGSLKPQEVTVVYKASTDSKVDGTVEELVF